MGNRVGQDLGKYKLVSLLGRGAFAEVYLGVDKALRRAVAIKVLHTHIDVQEESESFLDEARMIAHLNHQHIVKLHEYEVEQGVPFLVMDYAPGDSLRQFYRKRTERPLNSLVSCVKQVAEALQYAHNRKLIHCDVKPENILLDWDNSILLSDFGIALTVKSSHFHNTEKIAGTAVYMAPEQFQAKPEYASDQYALAILVYEWLCGEPPFQGNIIQLESMHRLTKPPSLSQKVPGLHPQIERVIFKALEKEPKKRFESVQKFASELEDAICTHIAQLPTGPYTESQPANPSGSAKNPPSTNSLPVPPPGETSIRTLSATDTRPPLSGGIPLSPPPSPIDNTPKKPPVQQGSKGLFWLITGISLALIVAFVISPLSGAFKTIIFPSSISPTPGHQATPLPTATATPDPPSSLSFSTAAAPTHQTSQTAPALIVFKGDLYLAFVANNGSNSILLTHSSDGTHWSQNIPTFQTSQSAPALAVFNGDLYLAFVANNSSHTLLIIHSSDGSHWSTNQAINQASKTAPTLTASPNYLYLAFVANNSSNSLLLVSSQNGRKWSQSVPVMQASKFAPTLIFFSSELYLAFVANNASQKLLLTTSARGISWLENSLPPAASSTAPSLGVFQNHLYLAFVARNATHRLLLLSSEEGSWSINPQVPQTSQMAPALVPFKLNLSGENLYLAFVADNGLREILVAPSVFTSTQ